MMMLVLLFLLAYSLGFLSAIPIGGSQIEMLKHAFRGRYREARFVIFGSVSSDIFYGLIAFFGFASFMEKTWIQVGFNIVGALILWALAYFTLKESKKPKDVLSDLSGTRSHRFAYLTGFTLALSNPPMILNWLLGLTLAQRLGLAVPFNSFAKFTFIAGGALGLGSYPTLLMNFAHKFKKALRVEVLGKIYKGLGIILFCLSFYFLYGAVRYLYRE